MVFPLVFPHVKAMNLRFPGHCLFPGPLSRASLPCHPEHRCQHGPSIKTESESGFLCLGFGWLLSAVVRKVFVLFFFLLVHKW